MNSHSKQATADTQFALDFDEFVLCLALCGHIKYERVVEMSLAQRVLGIICNYLGEKDERAVITEAVVVPQEPPPRTATLERFTGNVPQGAGAAVGNA